MNDSIRRTWPLKLVSREGMLLGTFTLPPDRYEILMQLAEKDSPYQFVVHNRSPISPAYNEKDIKRLIDNSSVTDAALCRAYHPEFYDAFLLYGLTIEEFERLPGHTFAPSVAYVRSLLG